MSSLLSRVWPGRRLSTLLLAFFVFLALVPAAVLTGVSYISERQDARQQSLTQLANYAESGEESLNNWATTTAGIISFDLGDATYQDIMLRIVNPETGIPNPVSQGAFLIRAQDIVNTSVFDYVVLLNRDGIVQGANDSNLRDMDLSSELWFTKALESDGEIVIIGPLYDPINRQDGMFFAGSVIDPNTREIVGVLAGRTGMTPISDVLSTTFPQGVLGRSRDYYLVGLGQKYITKPRFALQAGVAVDEILPIALSGKTGTDSWVDYHDSQVLGAYRWVDVLNMTLIVKQDQAEALADVEERTRTSLILGFGVAVIALILGVTVSRAITRPLDALSRTAAKLSEGDLDVHAPETRILEIQQVATSLNQMTGQLKQVLATQEDTIRARTRQLQMTAQIGRAIAAETDLERLLDVTISRIRDQLGHYHAQVFLLDDLRQYAVLRASTGDAGKTLLERGHKLPVGSRSVIGQVTTIGEPVLAGDTLSAENWMPNPLLPATRAELAVPIRVADQIIGALDVQSTEPDAFDEETIAALQTIADQLAVALRNSQLFEEKEGLISASVQLTQMLTRENWDSFLAERRAPKGQVGYQYDLMDVTPVGDGGNGHSTAEMGVGNGHGVSMPIALRGEVIGELAAELSDDQGLTEEDRNLVGQVLDRVALALENARLFEQTQASLQESNRLYQASRRFSAADTIEGLANALAELAALDTVDRVIVLLLDNPDDPPEDRWAEVVGTWIRDPEDQITNAFPKRLHTSQPPITTIENVEPTGLVFDDIDTAHMKRVIREAHQQMGVKSLAIFPLITGRRTVGWMVAHATRQAYVFNEATSRFYRTLSDQAAVALESVRLLEQTQTRARRLQATNEVSRAASSILNPDILLPLVVDRISEAFGYYHVQIFMVDELGKYATLRASTGDVGQKLLARAHGLEVGSQSVIGQVTHIGDPIIVRNAETDPIHKPNPLLPETRSEMAIPLKTGDRVIGALDVQSHLPNAFDGEAQQILQSLAGEMAVTMENAQLFQEIQDRVAELTTINLVAQSVSRANTLEELYDVVTMQLIGNFGARNGYLAIYDEAKQMIRLPLFLEQGELISVPAQPIGDGLTSHVIKSKQVLLVNEDAEGAARRMGARVVGSMAKSLLIVPLLLGEEVVGVISIQDHEMEHAYNEAHVRQMTTLAAYIAVKIRNAELLDEAQRRAGELGFLFDVTRAAVGSSDLDTALLNVVGILYEEVKGAESAIIYLASADGEKLEPHAAVGYGRDMAARGPIGWGQGLIGYAATLAQSLVVTNAQTDTRYAVLEDRTKAGMLVPLMTAAGLIGVLSVQSSQEGIFNDDTLRLLETASSTLTAIIQNAKLLEEVARANEELKEIDRLKSQFLAAMSHELRTPLNSIIGFSRVMLKGIDGPLNDLQTQDLSTIYNSGQHLLGLINDILDLSKIEAKMMEIQPEYTSMVEIINGVMSTAKGLTKDKPIELYMEIAPDLPQVWGDHTRLRQVLLNLVSNASKFTKEGNVTVRANRLDAEPETGRPARVQVDVIDTGIGIADDKLDKVFEAFQQADGSTTREYGGTGLGLPISKNFIMLHGGDMWVTSEVDKGSVFSFWVPLHPPASEGSELLTRAEGDTRPLVLAVDDEPGVIDLYVRYLEKEGYAVLGLGDANDIVQHVCNLQPSVVILDLNLPGKDGWLAINDLKQNLETQNVPIMVCSIEEDRERAANAGVVEYLVKPIIEDDLLAAMTRMMQGGPRLMHDVLVIDAYPDHAEYVRSSLEAMGDYNVKVVAVGYEGLSAIQEHAPAAVVIDLNLPDMDGYGLVAAMRSHPDTKHIPVVILTAREVTAEDLAKLGPWDITGYLSKYDYDGVRLAEKVAEVMTKAPKVAGN